MRLGRLGDSPTSCSDANPCTWWDEVWVRDDCLAFLRQCNPNDPRVIAMQSGFTAGVAAEAGTITGNAANAFTNNLFTNLDGSSNFGSIALIAVAGVVGVMVLQNLSRR